MPPEWHPSEAERRQVEAMSGYGVPHNDIATVLDVDPKTLRKHCRRELDVGMARANAKVAQTLFQQAVGGSIAAAIFWSKARMGWREVTAIELTGRDGGPVKLAHELTREQLEDARETARIIMLEPASDAE